MLPAASRWTWQVRTCWGIAIAAFYIKDGLIQNLWNQWNAALDAACTASLSLT